MSSEQVESNSSKSGSAVDTVAVNGASESTGNSNGNGPSKPRARLGPIETVQLPPDDSDSEPDEDDEPETEGGEAASEDFLKDYPDDTEVQHTISHLNKD
jgi:hypothetical protein